MLAFRKWTLSPEGYSSLTNAMRLASAITFLTLAVAAVAADAAQLASPQLPSPHQVDIPLSGGTLHAQLFKPDGDGPFPVVIALHGCAGLAGHSEPVLQRYRDWAEQLLKGGKAVLLPDSYGSRDLGPQCRGRVNHGLCQCFQAGRGLAVLLEPDQRDGEAMVGGMGAAALLPIHGEIAGGTRVFSGELHAAVIGRGIGVGRAGLCLRTPWRRGQQRRPARIAGKRDAGGEERNRDHRGAGEPHKDLRPGDGAVR